jgi:glutaredoxin
MADVNRVVELYGTAGCPYTSELREHLLWQGVEFAEYDIETDAQARERLTAIVGAQVVPVLVENGQVTSIGWQGRSCAVGGP